MLLEVDHKGNRIFQGTSQGTVVVWRLTDGAYLRTLPGLGGRLSDVRLRGDILAAAGPKLVRIWNAKSYAVLADLPAPSQVSIDISPDAKTLVSVESASGEIVRFWSLETYEEVGQARSKQPNLVRVIRYSPDGRWVVTAGGSPFLPIGRINIYDAHSRKLVGRLGDGSYGVITDLEFSPDSSYLVAPSGRAMVVYDLARRKLHATHQRIAGSSISGLHWLSRQRVVLADGAGLVELWDMQEGALLASLEVPGGKVDAFAVAQDESAVVAAKRNFLQVFPFPRPFDLRQVARESSFDGVQWRWEPVSPKLYTQPAAVYGATP